MTSGVRDKGQHDTGLSGRTVLVTGGARRIGAAIVRELHAAGMNVAVHYRRSAADAQSLVEQLNAERPDSAQVFQADLKDVQAIPELIVAVAQRWGGLYALVNNASEFFPTPVEEVSAKHWDDLFESNAKAPFFLSQAAAPYLREQGGAIVNIVDIYAQRPLVGYPIYSAAKGALVILSKALALELGPRVRVNAVAPGAILWPEDQPPDEVEKQATLASIPLGRTGSVEEVAGAVHYLLGADSAYITGAVLNIDGGRHLT